MLNEDWAQGQLSSIQAAIRSLPTETTEGLILCPVDHPLISAELVAQLIAQFGFDRETDRAADLPEAAWTSGDFPCVTL